MCSINVHSVAVITKTDEKQFKVSEMNRNQITECFMILCTCSRKYTRSRLELYF